MVCTDDLRTGSMENVAHLPDSKDLEYVEDDASGRLDEVYCSAYSVDFEWILILKVGVLGTHDALGLALVKEARLSSPGRARSTETRWSSSARKLLGHRAP